MPAYRYCFSTLDERITGEVFHSCPDDDAAVKFAETVSTEQPIIAVWREKRFVKRVVRLPLQRS